MVISDGWLAKRIPAAMQNGLPHVSRFRNEHAALDGNALGDRLGTKHGRFLFHHLRFDDGLFDRTHNLLVNDSRGGVGKVSRFVFGLTGLAFNHQSNNDDGQRKQVPAIHGKPFSFSDKGFGLGSYRLESAAKSAATNPSIQLNEACLQIRTNDNGELSETQRMVTKLSLDERFIEKLRCPIDGTTLAIADQPTVDRLNAAISDGTLRDRLEQKITEPIDGALITSDQQRAYLIRGGIPTMIADESVTL